MMDSYPRRRRWMLPKREFCDPACLDGLKLPSAVVRLLLLRGFNDSSKALAFLNPSIDNLTPPEMLPGVKSAVDRLVTALNANEHIIIYGDYDADGVTATALLYSGILRVGGNVDYFLPDRHADGYGLSSQVLQELSGQGCRLLVTVDTGISCAEEISLATQLGIDVIVTDHHELPLRLPEAAVAIVNPKLDTSLEEAYNMAGVGVSYRVLEALYKRLGRDVKELDSFLDLVAVGTVADVVPLLGDNRILVKCGLEVLRRGRRPGLSELARVSGVELPSLDSYSVGFGLAPRINAAGRMAHPSLAARLLLADNDTDAAALAAALDSENRTRQKKEKEIFDQAIEQADFYLNQEDLRWALVLLSEDWHQGIIGIVASRLVERYNVPVVMLSVQGGMAKGSARSVTGFNLVKSFEACKHLLVKYGGHEGAAGLTIELDKVDDFRRCMSSHAQETLRTLDLTPLLEIDDELAVDEVNTELVRSIESLAPFGMGNPKPVFMLRGLVPKQIKYVGADSRHLKVKLKTRGLEVDGIGFGLSRDVLALPDDPEPMDVAFSLEINTWAGRDCLQLNIKDVVPTRIEKPKSHDIMRLFGRLEVADRRWLTDKKDSLRFIIDSGDPMLIYLKGDKLVSDLAQALVKEWPQKLGRVYHYCAGVNPAQVVRRLAEGDCDILVTSCPLPVSTYFPGLRHVVLYHLCSTYQELQALLSMATGSSRVILHMLFGGQDAARQLDSAQRFAYNESNLEDIRSFITDMQELKADEILGRLWVIGGDGR